MTTSWTGVYAALATPLIADGSALDERALRRLVDVTVEAGVHGLIPCGSTGEFPALTSEERMRVAEVVIEQAAGRVPVVPQTGALTTAEAVRLSQHAQGLGAAGVMAVAPYYEPLTMDEAASYFRDISDSIDIPIMLYNLPHATGITMTGPWIAELRGKAPNVRYVKDTSGDMAAVLRFLHDHSRDFGTFVGWDTYTFAALSEGAPGIVIGATNLIAAELVAVYTAISEGRSADARALWDRVYPVLEVLLGGPYTSAVKAGMKIVGMDAGPTRKPMGPIAPERAAALRRALESLRYVTA